MNPSSKDWRRTVLWPRLAQLAFALACAWALFVGWGIEPG